MSITERNTIEENICEAVQMGSSSQRQQNRSLFSVPDAVLNMHSVNVYIGMHALVFIKMLNDCYTPCRSLGMTGVA